MVVRSGSPPPLGRNPSAPQIRRYALAADAAANHTTISLARIKGAPTSLVLLRPLYSDYVKLEALYGAVAHEPKGANLSAVLAQITEQERSAAAHARAARMPACAPHGGAP